MQSAHSASAEAGYMRLYWRALQPLLGRMHLHAADVYVCCSAAHVASLWTFGLRCRLTKGASAWHTLMLSAWGTVKGPRSHHTAQRSQPACGTCQRSALLNRCARLQPLQLRLGPEDQRSKLSSQSGRLHMTSARTVLDGGALLAPIGVQRLSEGNALLYTVSQCS